MEKIDPANPPREMTLLGGKQVKPFITVQDTWRKYGWKPKGEEKK